MKLTLSFLLSLFIAIQISFCQGFNEFINTYSDLNKEGYLQPMADLSISGFNAGLPLSAKISDGFYANLSLSAVYIKPAGSQRTFTGRTPDSFSEDLSAEASTIIGPNETTTVTASDGTSYVFGSGYNLNYLPWAFPQLTIGGIAGSELSLRFLVFDTDEDFGEYDHLGIGLRHSIDQYFSSTLPISLNLGYQFNKSNIGRYMKMKSHYFYLQSGYTVGLLDLMVYAGYQKGNFDVNYNFVSNGMSEEIEVPLNNSGVLLAGVNTKVQLGFFSISAGVAISKPVIASATIGFWFGGKNSNHNTDDESLNYQPIINDQ